MFVLVHSPLVGPTSWLPVKEELERRGRVAVVPSLRGVAEAPEPQWRHVPRAVRMATRHLHRRIILVGHSGAGLLLPGTADDSDNEVAALIFVDSFLPPAAGRVPLASPALMDRLRAAATEGVLAPWSRWFGADAMHELVPDERMRAVLEAEMPRLPLSYFQATVPVPEDWLNRPCGYVLLSAAAYGDSAAEARAYGWPVIEIRDVGHLAVATSAISVTDALLDVECFLQQSPRSASRT